nr:MAG TPA: hypothetical protein [Caudoviricetes sp.]
MIRLLLAFRVLREHDFLLSLSLTDFPLAILVRLFLFYRQHSNL